MLYPPFFTSSSSTQRPPDRESVYLKARQAWRAERWRERVRKDEGAEIKINLHHQFIRLVLLRLPACRARQGEKWIMLSHSFDFFSPPVSSERWTPSSQRGLSHQYRGGEARGRRQCWRTNWSLHHLLMRALPLISYILMPKGARLAESLFEAWTPRKLLIPQELFFYFSWELKSSFCQIFRVEKYSIVASPHTLP